MSDDVAELWRSGKKKNDKKTPNILFWVCFVSGKKKKSSILSLWEVRKMLI